MSLSFGVWDQFERQDRIDDVTQYAQRVRLVQRAEELGFRGYHIAEHHLSPLSMTPSPLIWLAGLARETSRIRLGSMIVIVPLYPTIRLAEELCMVDALSGGRLEVGVGRGIRDVEHEWFGADPSATREVYEEALGVIRDALRTGEVAVSTPEGGATAPMSHYPTQRPTPPFWYVGNLEYAARSGMSCLAHRPSAADAAAYFASFESYRAAGALYHQGASPLLASTRPIYLDRDPIAARERARRAFLALGDHFWATSTRVAGREFERGGPLGPGVPLEVAIEQGQVICGSPTEVGDALEAVLAHAGPQYNYLVNGFQWGDLTHEEAMASLELFGAEVMPRLSAAHDALGASA